jgi:hypothetical protein
VGKLIATRVNDEVYAKILSKCAGLSCSTYDYLKMLVESDVRERQVEQSDEADESGAERAPGSGALHRIALRYASRECL